MIWFPIFFGSVLDHGKYSSDHQLAPFLHAGYIEAAFIECRFALFFWWCLLVISDFCYFSVVYLTMSTCQEKIHWSPTCTAFTSRLYWGCFHRRFTLFFDGAYWWFPIFYYFSVVYLTMSTYQEKYIDHQLAPFLPAGYIEVLSSTIRIVFWWCLLVISDFLLFFGSVLDHEYKSGKNSVITNLHRFYQQVISRLLSSTIHIVFWWCLLVISDFLLFFGSVLDHEYMSGKNSLITNLHRFYQQVISRLLSSTVHIVFWWCLLVISDFLVVYLTMENIHWSPTCTAFTSRLYRGCFHRRFTLFFDGAYWWFPIFYYFSVV